MPPLSLPEDGASLGPEQIATYEAVALLSERAATSPTGVGSLWTPPGPRRWPIACERPLADRLRVLGPDHPRSGHDLVLVAELMGHRRLETTRGYTRPNRADRERAIGSLPTDR